MYLLPFLVDKGAVWWAAVPTLRRILISPTFCIKWLKCTLSAVKTRESYVSSFRTVSTTSTEKTATAITLNTRYRGTTDSAEVFCDIPSYFHAYAWRVHRLGYDNFLPGLYDLSLSSNLIIDITQSKTLTTSSENHNQHFVYNPWKLIEWRSSTMFSNTAVCDFKPNSC